MSPSLLLYREEEAVVIHCGKSLRTSSTGTVRPGLGVVDAFVNRGESFFIRVVKDRGWIVKVELLHASHIPIVADSSSSAKGAEIPGDPAISQRRAAREIYRQAPRERARASVPSGVTVPPSRKCERLYLGGGLGRPLHEMLDAVLPELAKSQPFIERQRRIERLLPSGG